MLSLGLALFPETSLIGITMLGLNVNEIGVYGEFSLGFGISNAGGSSLSFNFGIFDNKEVARGPYTEAGFSFGAIPSIGYDNITDLKLQEHIGSVISIGFISAGASVIETHGRVGITELFPIWKRYQ
jgi:hypothetical protein